MSFFLTHLLVGALVGAAVGLRLRLLPVAALAAVLADLDHLPLPGMTSRATLHSAAAVALLCGLVAILARRSWDRPDVRRLALAAPALLTSHLLLDLLPQVTEETSSAKVALLHPFSDQRYLLVALGGVGTDPAALSTFTILLAALLALVLLAREAVALAARGAAGPALALGAAGLLLAPALVAAGWAVPDHGAPAAAFEVEAEVLLPSGVLLATVRKVEGEDAWPRSLRLEVGGPVSRSITNPAWLTAGAPWEVRLPPAVAVLDAPATEVTLRAHHTDREYGAAVVRVKPGHLDHNLTLGELVAPPSSPGNWTLPVTLSAGEAAPAHSLRLVVRDAAGVERLNHTNEDSMPPGRTWRPVFPAGGTAPFWAELLALDGHRHAERRALAAP